MARYLGRRIGCCAKWKQEYHPEEGRRIVSPVDEASRGGFSPGKWALEVCTPMLLATPTHNRLTSLITPVMTERKNKRPFHPGRTRSPLARLRRRRQHAAAARGKAWHGHARSGQAEQEG